jgi:hypothetical protein
MPDVGLRNTLFTFFTFFTGERDLWRGSLDVVALGLFKWNLSMMLYLGAASISGVVVGLERICTGMEIEDVEGIGEESVGRVSCVLMALVCLELRLGVVYIVSLFTVIRLLSGLHLDTCKGTGVCIQSMPDIELGFTLLTVFTGKMNFRRGSFGVVAPGSLDWTLLGALNWTLLGSL